MLAIQRLVRIGGGRGGRKANFSLLLSGPLKALQPSKFAGGRYVAYWTGLSVVGSIAGLSHCDSFGVKELSQPVQIIHTQPSVAASTSTSLLKKNIRWFFRLLKRILYLIWMYFPAFLSSPLLFYPGTAIYEEWWKLFRSCIQASGPCSIKLAQWISTRPDLFPRTLCAHFQDLQSNHVVPSWETIEPIFQERFGADWSHFLEIHHKEDGSVRVLGAGCVAQVLHGAVWQTTKRGSNNNHSNKRIKRDVAIKIIHPNVKESILADIELMRALITSLEYWIPASRQISLLDSVEEFATLMINQVDMRIEAYNLDRFRKNFSTMDSGTMLLNFFTRARTTSDVHFPEPIWEFTNEDILVEEFAPGILIRDYIKTCSEAEKKQIAAIGVDAIFKMVFLDNFIHADLHPGNIVYAPDNKGRGMQLMFIDAGLAVELQPNDQHNLVELFQAVITNDGVAVGKLMIERSRAKHLVLDAEEFTKEMGQIVNDVHKSGLTLARLGVSELLQKVLILCFKHQVKLESRFASVIVAMGVVEGLGRQLDPDMDILMRAAPYVLRAAVQK